MHESHGTLFRQSWSHRTAWLLAIAACLFGACDKSTRQSQATTRIGVVGLQTTTMNYNAAEQQAQNWCWAASIQMALSAKGIDVGQKEVVINAFGEAVDRPGSVIDVLRNLNGWSISRGGKPIRVTGSAGLGPPSFETLKRQLERGTPVIVGYDNPEHNVGHAVVVTAVIYENASQGPEIRRVMVRDPWPTRSGQLGKRE